MFQQIKLQQLNDYFLPLASRAGNFVFFYRIASYDETVKAFAPRYYEQARKNGVLIEKRIQNPTKENLEYYNEIMGTNFRMEQSFVSTALRKWLPRLNESQNSSVTAAMFSALQDLQAEGKNENILRNVYTKFMCWLYYKFERIVNRLGTEEIPKIFFEGSVNQYELRLLTILSRAGADVVLLETGGDAEYGKVDPAGLQSQLYVGTEQAPFPEGFDLQQIQKSVAAEINARRLYGPAPKQLNCTNAWMKGQGLEDVLTDPQSRGQDARFYYNSLLRICGVSDKVNYANELYQFYLKLKNNGRNVCVIDNAIPPPTPEETNAIKRGQYKTADQLMMDLGSNIRYTANAELSRMMHTAFIDVMREEAAREENMPRLNTFAVHLLCWLHRYQSALFSGYKPNDMGVFVLLGGCQKKREAVFLRFLAKLPVDVVILLPDKNSHCVLKADNLLELHYDESLPLAHFPTEQANLRAGTAAYHAERELDTLMYQDSGVYRNYQFGKATVISLQTMYEEIAILWDKEVKYRPNFSTTQDAVNLPVICAKISGVKDGQTANYWAEVEKLTGKNAFVIKRAPFLSATDANPMKPHVTQFLRGKVLQRSRIMEHSAYPYGVLRSEMQEHLLDKLQLLLDQKLIRGTYENGMEYTIVAVALNLDKQLLRLIQNFDFTKENPKLVYINTTEEIISVEDSILAAYLHLVGFDVVFCVPTGYQSIERHFNKQIVEEHQIGEYMYDLVVPNLNQGGTKGRQSWREKIFGKGG